MADLADGERVEVTGSQATYTLARIGSTYSCTCPSWTQQSAPPAKRTCKHLRGLLGETHERERTGYSPAVPKLSPRPSWVRRVREDKELRMKRRRALAAALEAFPVAYDKMQLVYGLRMPKHLAYAIGWWDGLTDEERSEAWGYIGTGPCGISTWFSEGGLDRRVREGLDERLQFRFRCDPPEMVTIFGGNSDGSHWGLWYDDPAELPRVICHNWARDSAETGANEPTLLGTFREHLYGEHREPLDDGYTHYPAILDWLDEVHVKELEAHREETIAPFVSRVETVGGLGPWVPKWSPPSWLGESYKRYEKYRAKDPEVERWIAEARSQLAAGQPGLALVIGRDLHWLDDDATRDICTELLVGGYRALGRDAIAEIVRVHHAKRDLATVDVYDNDEPAPTPFQTALWHGRLEEVARLLAETEAPRELVKTLRDVSGPMLELLLPHASPSVIEDAQLGHLEQLLFWKDDPDGERTYAERRAPHEQALAYLLDRTPVSGYALERFLRADPSRVATYVHEALAKADLSWRSELGRSVLHVACRLGHVDAVRALLARGADVKLKDADGETPYDAVRDAWETHRKEAGEIYDLLRAHGGGPPPKVAAVPEGTWDVGTRVTHAKFGEGKVTAATGRGDDAKLVIEFGGAHGTKQVVGKFVKRVS